MTKVHVAIPVKDGEKRKYLEATIQTLRAQTYPNLKIVVVPDQGRGASWARNEGAWMAGLDDLLLFSDDDVLWEPDAVRRMVMALEEHSLASFAYGPYEWIYPPDPNQLGVGGYRHHSIPGVEWDIVVLRLWNYVSTMSLIRRQDFLGFDVTLSRLQDWELWLRMAHCNYRGVLVPGDNILFRQVAQPGITLDADLKSAPGFEEAREKLVRKGLLSAR